MKVNPIDLNKTTEELQIEASVTGTSEERIKEILASLLTRTVEHWKNPGWFTEWVSTNSHKETKQFLEDTLESLKSLEMYELCKDVELMQGQVELFHSIYKK